MKSGNLNNKNKNIVIILLIIILSFILRCLTIYSLPSLQNNLKLKDDFNVDNAKYYIKNITSIGPRISGTYNLEIVATNILLNALKDIQSKSLPNILIEIEVQHPSSYFDLNFLGGMTNIYNNITNVVVKLSWKETSSKLNKNRAILINSHYDTIHGSPGASDDAVGAACMLETIRVLSQGKKLHNPIIFLFNGAEESMMQGAHGFITQHRWALDVAYVINLEAMGAGGKELMFQCNSEWMATFYLKHAKYPNANVLANELFDQFLWRTAATDFRTFLAHGPPGIVGIDNAYILNGYVYHTSFDKIDAIPDETLLHTGENLVSLSRALSLYNNNDDDNDNHNNGYILTSKTNTIESKSDKINEFIHSPRPISSSHAVYFDIFNLYIIYTGSSFIFIIHTCFLLLGFYKLSHFSGISPFQSFLTFIKYLFHSSLNEFYCILICLIVNILLSLIYHLFIPMIWYDQGVLMAFILYLPPTILISFDIRSRYLRIYSQTQGIANILSLWLILLIFAILFNLMVGYISSLYILSIFCVSYMTNTITNYMHHRAPVLGFDRSKLINLFVRYSYEICQIPILYIWWSVFYPLFIMIIPLTGKIGTVVPSDIIISILICLTVSIGWTIILPNIIYQPIHNNLKFIWISYFIIVLILGFSFTTYSSIHPKRLWIQHIHREINYPNEKNQSPYIDSGLWISGFDATGVNPILPYSSSSLASSTTYKRNKNIFNHLLSNNNGNNLDKYSCSGWNGDCYFLYPHSYPVADALQDFIFIPTSITSPEMIHSVNKLQLNIYSTNLINMHDLNDQKDQHFLRKQSQKQEQKREQDYNSLPKKLKIVCLILSGTTHMTLAIREIKSSNIVRWAIPSNNEYDKYTETNPPKSIDDIWHQLIKRSDGLYYIQIGFGYCPQNICKQKIFIEIEVEDNSNNNDNDNMLEIAAYSHNVEKKTIEMETYLKQLPNWLRGAEWLQYQSQIVVKYI